MVFLPPQQYLNSSGAPSSQSDVVLVRKQLSSQGTGSLHLPSGAKAMHFPSPTWKASQKLSVLTKQTSAHP